MGASISELAEVVALAEEGRLKLRSQRFPLDKAPEVYELMHAGKMPVRAVITPNG
jgi:propanol-preferring alcohol dehydrogenase